jgi:hypothetical protein
VRWHLAQPSHSHTLAGANRRNSSHLSSASPSWCMQVGTLVGMPLARRATQANISAIYVGGLIQLLFGITGRWYLDARGLI